MNKIDASLDEVQNTRFRNIYHDLVKQMEKVTQFSEMELNCILLVYHKFVLINGPKAKFMSKKQFFKVFEVLFNIYDVFIIERVLMIIAKDLKKDIDPIAWVKLFSVCMTDSLQEKINFCFMIYDIHGVRTLNREVITKYVENFFTGEDEDEVTELTSSMVDVLFRKFDVDKDGLISFEDYESVVMKQPLLLEFLGICLPETNGLTVIAYCSNIISRINKLGL